MREFFFFTYINLDFVNVLLFILSRSNVLVFFREKFYFELKKKYIYMLLRDEQADEQVRLRKSLEQSNKNCRILSFKLRKVERKVEELESEKSTLEQKYEEASSFVKFESKN